MLVLRPGKARQNPAFSKSARQLLCPQCWSGSQNLMQHTFTYAADVSVACYNSGCDTQCQSNMTVLLLSAAVTGLKINAKLGGVNVRLAGNPDQV